MEHTNPQFGLVLAGGGAKGAYQAGVCKYLAEIGLEPKIIAGTSIGTLNGAVLASSQSFAQGVQRLNQLWEQLGQKQVIRPNKSAVLKMLSYGAKAFIPSLRTWWFDFLVKIGLPKDHNAIFDPEPVETLLREAVDPAKLRQGVELWATVFPALKIPGLDYDLLMPLVDLLRAQAGTSAHWLRVQDCQDDETLYNLLLASAAIPLAFPQREVNGQFYVDGAFGDNIPLGALAARGCTFAIVIHLDNGETWSRHNFPDQTIIEIRPEQQINKSNTPVIGFIDSLLDFSPERITELKKRGYEDAQRYLKPILETFIAIRAIRYSDQKVLPLIQKLQNDRPLLDDQQV
ncbi:MULTISPECIES: patatin-like phospholipase family protein [unclassified Moorena]|uniref:patatin-like phospholipase family protein n=1 Tax=unclassified Moorena TaxID=2683338 RepID=UPI0013BDFFF8|nr:MULTISPECIES: patatin-like phospholipase family protein [unclassified Moorena]NER91630.1 patatin-like phospholipase family protein [Moorena sp. SIO3A2]NES86853.1 patatin-like phospholipase family protein [Moorena sp. SIO2B7]NET63282.1 patatin-like phospholipase family protein [Moorena sp. SIO1G6]